MYDKLKNEWQSVELTKEFHNKIKKYNLSENQLLVLTPFVVQSKYYEELQKAYIYSARKLNRFYSVPMFSWGHIVYYKNLSYYIFNLYHLFEWDKFLFREIGYKLNLSIFLNSKAKKVLDKRINFWIKDEKDSFILFPKVRKNDKTFGYGVDDILKLKEIK